MSPSNPCPAPRATDRAFGRKTAAVRREEIVLAAIGITDVAGPAGLTTTAKAIGLTQPALFRHFPRKDDVLLAVVEWIGSRVLGRLTAATAASGTAVERLRRGVETCLACITETPAIPAILFGRELYAGCPALRTTVLEHQERLHRRFAEIVEAGAETGEFRVDLPSDRAVFLVIGLVRGLVVRWLLSDRALDLVAEGMAMLDILMTGFGFRSADAPPHPKEADTPCPPPHLAV